MVRRDREIVGLQNRADPSGEEESGGCSIWRLEVPFTMEDDMVRFGFNHKTRKRDTQFLEIILVKMMANHDINNKGFSHQNGKSIPIYAIAESRPGLLFDPLMLALEM